MATKIKAKQTIAGDYGKLDTGSEATVSDKLARELESLGLVQIIGPSEEPEEDSQEAKQRRAFVSMRP